LEPPRRHPPYLDERRPYDFQPFWPASHLPCVDWVLQGHCVAAAVEERRCAAFLSAANVALLFW
jgi:hypothetical protein